MHPLHKSQVGERVEFCAFSCNCQDACRLRELGCVEGQQAKIISNNPNVVLQIGESRIAISQKVACGILVSLNKSH